jgi:hypothetical protein
MTMPQPKLRSRPNRARAPRRREGIALVVVLLVIMLTTATATYAVHNTQFEVRGAGATMRAMDAKYKAESSAIAGIGFLNALGGVLPPPNDMLPDMGKYGLPALELGSEDQPRVLGDVDFTAANPNFFAAAMPTAAQLAGGGTVSGYLGRSTTVLEVWTLPPAPGSTEPRTRVVATTFGETSLAGDITRAGQQRQARESVSIARAYYDME